MVLIRKESFDRFEIMISLLCLIVTTSLSSSMNAFANSTYSMNRTAIQEVKDGKRMEANAAWWGFSEVDSTTSLQAAIRSKAKRIIVPNMGRPWVVASLLMESDKEIVFEKGAVIEAKPGAFRDKTAALLKCINKKNISLTGYGAKFKMQKQDYMRPPYEKSEWRHAISIHGCEDMKIFGLQLINSGGDGIYVGRGIGKNSVLSSNNIHIKDVVCSKNYRQGISIISASNLIIENSIFQHTEGTSPQSGIDFEPNHPDEVISNCKVRNCIVSDNFGFGIEIYLPALNKTSKDVSIEIEGCKILRNKRWPIFIAGKNKRNFGDPRGKIIVRNCMIDGKVQLHETQGLEITIE